MVIYVGMLQPENKTHTTETFFASCASWKLLAVHWGMGSMYVSGKLPSYTSRNLTFCPKQEVSVNVRFGEG